MGMFFISESKKGGLTSRRNRGLEKRNGTEEYS